MSFLTNIKKSFTNWMRKDPEQEDTVGKEKLSVIEKYQSYLDQAGFKFNALHWIAFGMILSFVAGVGAALLITLMLPGVSLLMAFIIFLVVFDLFLGYPYLVALKKIDAIEEELPNALKQMADVLKAGGTYESALRQVASSEYGPLTREMELVLRRTEEGESLENALKDFADSVHSRLVERSITVIVDTVKAGAGLAGVLDDIADDIRAMHRIEKERITETVLQVIFMVSAGAIIAPAILGLVTSVINLFISSAGSLNVSQQVIAGAVSAKDTIIILMQVYIFFEVTAASAMVSLMRSGKLGKALLYMPILLLIAYLIYYATAAISGSFLVV